MLAPGKIWARRSSQLVTAWLLLLSFHELFHCNCTERTLYAVLDIITKKFAKKISNNRNRSDLSLFLFDSSGCVLILLFDSSKGGEDTVWDLGRSSEFSLIVFSPVPVLYCDSSWHLLRSGRAREGRGSIRVGNLGFGGELVFKRRKRKGNFYIWPIYNIHNIQVLAGLLEYTANSHVFVFSKPLRGFIQRATWSVCVSGCIVICQYGYRYIWKGRSV